MGRFGASGNLEGSIKSIQHFSQSVAKNTTQNVTITAVSNTNKAYVVTSQQSTGCGGYEYAETRSGMAMSNAGTRLTSTTNVALTVPNVDVFDGGEYMNRTGTVKGSVIEVY